MSAEQPLGVKIDVAHVKFNVVRQAMHELGVIETKDDKEAKIFWWDGLMKRDAFLKVSPNQRISKIPGMDMLCYKSQTFRAFNRMRGFYPSFFTFFPRTYILPFEFKDFQMDHLRTMSTSNEPVTWIFKPRSGCCGNGIRLIQNSFEVSYRNSSGIVQKYVEPYLIDGFKFDFRFYILVSNLDPFTVYVYNEGLARFCTDKYRPPARENLEDRFCHLTNTSVNVGNESAQNSYLQMASSVVESIQRKEDKPDLWANIKHAITLSMVAQYAEIVAQVREMELMNPRIDGIRHMNRYFHILGIDVMLDRDLRPMVLEMNDRPSMAVTFDIEDGLKTHLVRDAIRIIAADIEIQTESVNLGGWESLLPMSTDTPLGRSVSGMMAKSMRLKDRARMPRIMSRQTYQTFRPIRKVESSLPPLRINLFSRE